MPLTSSLDQADVPQLLELISEVRREYGLATRVRSLLEPNDYAVLDVYRHRRSAYFVAVMDNDVLGGAGIFPLAGGDWATCELQRMHLRPRHRGRGIGQSHILYPRVHPERSRTYAVEGSRCE